MHLKLEKELDIRKFIESVAYNDSYKTILKSVKTLNDKVAKAQELSVDLDVGLIGDVNKCTSRLISERDLRHEVEKSVVPKSDHDSVNKMKNLIDRAQETGVAPQYMEQGEKVQTVMSGNIKAREILQMLVDYPVREYPEPEIVDPKKKKKEEPKKKKKKKKEPPFPLPEWATEIDSLVTQVQTIQGLIADAGHLQLDEDFVKKTNE